MSWETGKNSLSILNPIRVMLDDVKLCLRFVDLWKIPPIQFSRVTDYEGVLLQLLTTLHSLPQRRMTRRSGGYFPDGSALSFKERRRLEQLELVLRGYYEDFLGEDKKGKLLHIEEVIGERICLFRFHYDRESAYIPFLSEIGRIVVAYDLLSPLHRRLLELWEEDNKRGGHW